MVRKLKMKLEMMWEKIITKKFQRALKKGKVIE